MTVIHTTDDLIRLLNENDEFRQAVRRHVLSDELIQLPERLAKFETHVEDFMGEQRQFNKEQQQFNKEQQQFNKEQRQFNKEQQQFNKEQKQFNKEQKQFNQQVESSIGEIRVELAQQGKTLKQQTDAIGEIRVELAQQGKTLKQHTDAIGEIRVELAQQGKTLKQQTDAIGELRGKVARQVVGVHFLEITDAMGFRFKGLLTRLDLGQLIFQREIDIPLGDRRSFFRADLVIEATDSQDVMHYIAVEASYTADQRDTSRAQRNAALLTQLTGHPAHAAIASVRNVHEIQTLIDNGTVYWYALEPNDFTPE